MLRMPEAPAAWSTAAPRTGATVAALLDWFERHRRVLVLTGAGLSTESGIPDYRDERGRWKRPAPVMFQAFVGDAATRRRYWARSMVGWRVMGSAGPGAAHHALAALAHAGRVRAVLTQNVDGLHAAAGSPEVVDLHGRIDQVRCLDCGDRTPRAALQRRLLDANPRWADRSARIAPDGDADLEAIAWADTFDDFAVPACERCGGLLKPDVVFYGEQVPAARVAAAQALLESSDAMLVAGTSLIVRSGLRFVEAAHARALPLAAVNLGMTRADDWLDVKVTQPVGAVLPELAAALAGTTDQRGAGSQASA